MYMYVLFETRHRFDVTWRNQKSPLKTHLSHFTICRLFPFPILVLPGAGGQAIICYCPAPNCV